MKTCIILGDRSDLAQAMLPFLLADGWTVHGWNRESSSLPVADWDLLLIAIGAVAPVGPWPGLSFRGCFESNLLLPLDLLQRMWPQRNPGASVCWLAGSNPQRIMYGYAPYNTSKMGLLKLIEQLDYEEPDCKFFALGPGYVKTKIHRATLDANWPNERIARGDEGTPIERIYECLKWCIDAPKIAVGGRNIVASDPWDSPAFADQLRLRPDMFKLRRVE